MATHSKGNKTGLSLTKKVHTRMNFFLSGALLTSTPLYMPIKVSEYLLRTNRQNLISFGGILNIPIWCYNTFRATFPAISSFLHCLTLY